MTDSSDREEFADLAGVTVVALTGVLDRSGGAERAFRAIVEGFEQRLGMSVRLAAHLPPNDPDVRERATVLRPEGAAAGPGMIGRMRGLIASVEAPAILFGFQINSNVLVSLANALIAPSRRLPIVLNDRAAIDAITTAPPGSGVKGRLRVTAFRAAARVAYRRADCVVCNSRANADRLREFVGREEPPIETIYNPLDAAGIQARFGARSRERFQSADGPVVVSHGRLDAQKGFDTLIRAFARVRRDWPSARLRIVGEGAERAALEALIAEHDLTAAAALPGFSADPLAEIDAGDVYVLPSRWEGLPNALLEAVALGLPAIATDCPTGPSEILSPAGEAGELFPVDDVSALADRLRELLADGGRRAALSAAARRRALDFSPDASARAYAAVFRRVLATRSR